MEHSIDRGKVIAWLNEIVDTLGSFTDESEQEVCQLAKDAIALLKEQEAVEPRVSSVEQRCGNCNKVIEMDGWKTCPWCG